MTDTTVASGNVVTRWERKFLKEWVRNNRFNPYMGMNENSIIHVNERLQGQRGKTVSIPLIGKLSGAGVSGNTKLEDAEEALDNYNHDIDVETYRNAVVRTDREQQFTEIDLLNAARPMLMTWAMEDMRDKIITALGSIDGTAYSTAAEAAKDTWLGNNSDRVLFGKNLSNAGSTSDHSSALSLLDSSDNMSAGIVSLAKRIAKTANPRIRPFRIAGKEDQEWYVLFTGSLPFRDLKADTTISQANREGWQRYGGTIGQNNGNPIFVDGDLIYDGVIIREVPEIFVASGAGAGSIDVAPSFLCGAQAVGLGWAKRPKAVFENRDYGFRRGAGVEFMYGIEKLIFQSTKQHGVVTIWTPAVADA